MTLLCRSLTPTVSSTQNRESLGPPSQHVQKSPASSLCTPRTLDIRRFCVPATSYTIKRSFSLLDYAEPNQREAELDRVKHRQKRWLYQVKCKNVNFKQAKFAFLQTSLVQAALVILYLRYMLPYKAEG